MEVTDIPAKQEQEKKRFVEFLILQEAVNRKPVILQIFFKDSWHMVALVSKNTIIA